MGALQSVTDRTFDEKVLRAEGTVIVDFWAVWCPPCRAMELVLEQLAAEHPEITILMLNADDELDTARTYRAMSLPTLKVFRDGEVVSTIVGARPRAALELALRPYLTEASTDPGR
jgi:thioredoxin 1